MRNPGPAGYRKWSRRRFEREMSVIIPANPSGFLIPVRRPGAEPRTPRFSNRLLPETVHVSWRWAHQGANPFHQGMVKVGWVDCNDFSGRIRVFPTRSETRVGQNLPRTTSATGVGLLLRDVLALRMDAKLSPTGSASPIGEPTRRFFRHREPTARRPYRRRWPRGPARTGSPRVGSGRSAPGGSPFRCA